MFLFPPSARILVILTVSFILLSGLLTSAAPAPDITASEAERQGSRALFRTAGRNLKDGAVGMYQIPKAGYHGAKNSVANVKTHWKAGNYGKAFASAGGIVGKPVGSLGLALASPFIGTAGAVTAGVTAGVTYMNSKDTASAERYYGTSQKGGGVATQDRMEHRNENLKYNYGHLQRLVTGRKAQK